MTLHQLRIFNAVASSLNITKAASELRIGQPTVTQQLKLLQEEYGAVFYQRQGRGIRLTDAGKAFWRDIQAILKQVEVLKRQFHKQGTDRMAGTLSIAGSHSPSASFLPMLLTVFNETHPLVGISLKTDTSRGVERYILSGEAEIGVITNCSRNDGLTVESLGQEKLVFFASPKHPWGKKDKLTLAELVETPLVVKRGKEGEDRVGETLRHLREQGHALNVVMYCESPEAAKAAVRNGIGMGILFQDIVQRELHSGELKIIKVPDLKLTIETFIVRHKNTPLSPYGRDFLTLLRGWPSKTRRRVRKTLPRTHDRAKLKDAPSGVPLP
jgi:DNA-binding transcriptional LysR family regulator